MIFDISMGLNGIPLCINVKYKGKSFNSIKRELHSILNGIPLIKSNESKWSMRIQLDWMESHYVTMYSQLILKGNHSINLNRKCDIASFLWKERKHFEEILHKKFIRVKKISWWQSFLLWETKKNWMDWTCRTRET